MNDNKNLKEVGDKILDLAELSFDFSDTYRATYKKNGQDFESDIDHTFMLSLCAVSFAKKFYKDLSIEKISLFALVHDLVEVYAGDTDTVKNKSEKALKDKEDRELAALRKIKNKFGDVFPWLHKTIIEYEKQESREARFVKILDKIMSELPDILNNNAYFRKNNFDLDYMVEYMKYKENKYRVYFEEFPEIFSLYKYYSTKTIESYKNMSCK